MELLSAAVVRRAIQNSRKATCQSVETARRPVFRVEGFGVLGTGKLGLRRIREQAVAIAATVAA